MWYGKPSIIGDSSSSDGVLNMDLNEKVDALNEKVDALIEFAELLVEMSDGLDYSRSAMQLDKIENK